MKIHVFYRHTNVIRATMSDRPSWFSHKKCFDNLLKTIVNSPFRDKVVLHFIFDGTEDELKFDDCYRSFLDHDVYIETHISLIHGGNQRRAWKRCLALVMENIKENIIDDDDIIYFLENDYVHTDEWLSCLFDLVVSNVSWDYATLYDHPDKYVGFCSHPDANKNLRIKSKIYYSGSRHWRSTPSTCATYILSRRTFVKDYWILKYGIYDYKLFFILSKIFRRNLISPMPSLSTHSMESLLAPAIDWTRYLNE
ncbi:hypothetical protein KXJ75_15905 [Aeromonas sanarellii]|nr:hypothetical protein KXJ75_15905 [Aeromonas sanarellii]